MKCEATLKVEELVLECDWPKEHDGWAHVNKNTQILWTDKGIKWSSKWIINWDHLPEEMKPLINVVSTYDNWMWTGERR